VTEEYFQSGMNSHTAHTVMTRSYYTMMTAITPFNQRATFNRMRVALVSLLLISLSPVVVAQEITGEYGGKIDFSAFPHLFFVGPESAYPRSSYTVHVASQYYCSTAYVYAR
jgi:hypothetical protein